ncbi:MAG: septum formation protein Maf [Candidatus Chloroheliales bacterium]|nr:MAG: septum formation protein Maf [Chloroflexota bacterium]
MADLILASGSPRRRELLRRLGLPFAIHPADVDETLLPDELPSSAVMRLAASKAEAIATRFPTAIILAADTLVVDPPATILGKPANPTAAGEMLRRLRGRQHIVITALTLRQDSEPQSGTATTLVQMRDYSDAEIEAYIASGDSLDKAGGYAIQYQDFRPVATIEGCYTNVVGLPLCLTYALLYEAGLRPDISALVACNAYGNRCPTASTMLGR